MLEKGTQGIDTISNQTFIMYLFVFCKFIQSSLTLSSGLLLDISLIFFMYAVQVSVYFPRSVV